MDPVSGIQGTDKKKNALTCFLFQENLKHSHLMDFEFSFIIFIIVL